jgi:hypothetical protein
LGIDFTLDAACPTGPPGPPAVARLRHTTKSCPTCSQTLVRVRRTAADREVVDPATGWQMGRYRCANLACGWQGLLPRQSMRQMQREQRLRHRPSRSLRQRVVALNLPWAQAGSVLLVMALLVLVGVQGARHLLGAQPQQVSTAVPAGESHDGDPLPARHPWVRPVVLTAADLAAPPVAPAANPAELAASWLAPSAGLPTAGLPGPGAASAADFGLALPAPVMAAAPPAAAPAAPAVPIDPLEMRRGCAWGKPGRNPYTGSVEQALLHARLPPEVVAEVSRKVRAKEVSDRLEIRTGSIRGVKHGRDFDPQRVAMSFGRTLCLNSRVNFAPGHVERADLYEVKDARGRQHAVMVPDVCGNVSVLGERGERRRALVAAGGGTDEEWWALATLAAMSDGGTVPEPGTLAAVLAALAALVVAQRARARRLPAAGRAVERSASGG